MTIKAREFDHLVEKLQLRTRDSGDRLAWLEHEGKVVVRTRRSFGKGDVPLQHAIRQQLKLNEEELHRAVACKLSREEYLDILRRKGFLPSS